MLTWRVKKKNPIIRSNNGTFMLVKKTWELIVLWRFGMFLSSLPKVSHWNRSTLSISVKCRDRRTSQHPNDCLYFSRHLNGFSVSRVCYSRLLGGLRLYRHWFETPKLWPKFSRPQKCTRSSKVKLSVLVWMRDNSQMQHTTVLLSDLRTLNFLHFLKTS